MTNPDLDIDPVNSDALRAGHWDIWRLDYSGPADTLLSLRESLGLLPLNRQEISDWLRNARTLPFWRAAPQKLKDEVDAYLEGGSTGDG